MGREATPWNQLNQSNRYLVLRPIPGRAKQVCPPILLGISFLDVTTRLTAAGGILHLDIETTGLDPLAPEARIVALSLAHSTGHWAWDVREWSDVEWEALHGLLQRNGAAAFNAGFDGMWLNWQWVQRGWDTVPLLCTFVLFKMLASEDWPGQRWNLQVAQEDILGWEVSNKDDLAAALSKHGIADKGDMWKLIDLESELFLTYCGHDAAASQQLLEELEARTVHTAGEAAWQAAYGLARDEWAGLLQCLGEQRLAGMNFDLEGARRVLTDIELQIRVTKGKIRAHPDAAPAIKAWEKAAHARQYAPAITTSRVRASSLEEVRSDPGWVFIPSAAKSLKSWQRDLGGYFVKETAVVSPRGNPDAPEMFNFESGNSLRWLLWGAPETNHPEFEGMFGARITKALADKGDEEVAIIIGPDGGQVTVPLTASGKLPTAKTVLGLLGDFGKLLLEHSKLTKLRGYVESYIMAAEGAADQRLHPEFRPHGTSTGRQAGGSST